MIAVETGSLIGGRYRLVRCIGAGGMGEVWEAVHEVTSKRVAIKVLNATYAGQAEVRARFLQEARAACCVRHPNVVQIHDVIETAGGAPAMVMDLLNGESLGGLVERVRAIPLPELAAVLAPAIDAVAAAHAMGIVHRDLKPDNLFLEKGLDGHVTVRVLDFGIAKVITDPTQRSSSDCALTKTGALLGTPYYMSPEQAFGEKDLDHRSDIYSLGLIIHECLTGRRPTEADNFGQIMKLITTGGIPPLANVVRDVPADVSEIVVRMLSVSRDARPTLAEVHAVLSRYARCAPAISFAPPRMVESTAPAVAAIDTSSQPNLESTGSSFEVSMPAGVPRPFGRIVALASIAACTVAIMGGALFHVTSGRDTRSAAAAGIVASQPLAQAEPTPAPVAIAPPAPEPSAPVVVTPPPVVAAPARAVTAAPAKSAPARAPKVEVAAAPAAPAAPAPQKRESIAKIPDGPAPF